MFIKGKNGESRKAKDLSTTSKHYSRGKRKLEQNRAEAAVGQPLHMGLWFTSRAGVLQQRGREDTECRVPNISTTNVSLVTFPLYYFKHCLCINIYFIKLCIN